MPEQPSTRSAFPVGVAAGQIPPEQQGSVDWREALWRHDALFRAAVRRHGGALVQGGAGAIPATHDARTCTAAAATAEQQNCPTPGGGAVPNNLPVPLSSFVGRGLEVAAVKQLLAHARLLTLTGPGGCGKTRLSLQVAADLLREYPDGVWLVELAALTDPGLVPEAVAAVLGVREEPGRSSLQVLTSYLQARHLLVIIDNCEHLVAACAQVFHTLLRACPGLRILATSREAVGIAGETVWPVPTLTVPDLDHPPSAAAVSQYESAHLFVDRVAATQPSFTLTDQNAPIIAHICRRLDGIPLAIELAAARVKVLSLDQIAERLDDRFRLLTGGRRTALARQQTLRAAVEWSYDLLTAKERALWCRLSIFAGWFSLEAMETICSGEGLEAVELLDLLSQLVGKSLVVTEEQDGITGYRLLETMRQYGEQRLREWGAAVSLRRSYLEWYLALAERAESGFQSPEQRLWLGRLEQEHDNLRSALHIAEEGGETAALLRLAGALARFWWMRGYLNEGRSWLSRGLTVSGGAPAAVRAKALNAAGTFAFKQGDHRAADSYYSEALALQRQLGNPRGTAAALGNLGNVAQLCGDYGRAAALYADSLKIFREIGDHWGIAMALINLGNVSLNQGDHAGATACYEESRSLQQHLGDHGGVASAIGNLGRVAQLQGNSGQAATLYEESLAIFRSLGDKQGEANTLHSLASVVKDQGDLKRATALYRQCLALQRELMDRKGIAECLEGFAGIANALGPAEQAVRFLATAEALREAIQAPLPPADRAEHDRDVAMARSRLKETAFTALWEAARGLALEQVLAEAAQFDLPERARPTRPLSPGGLTQQEVMVVRLVARGLTNRQVAGELGISTRTVDAHLQNIFTKLDLPNRAAVVAWAVPRGLTEPPG